jgi:RNA polymerase sigma-70 factor (ECF subfamily)
VDYKKFSDQTLLQLMEQKDENALGELYDRYSRLIFSIALNSLGEGAAAEEVTQDVFFRVWKNAASYRKESGKVATWIAGITRNRSIDEIRHLSIRPEAEANFWEDGESDLWADIADVEQNVELLQQSNQIRMSVASLPAEQRQALTYAYFLGFSHSEIASFLDEPLGTIKTRIRLAMKKIKIDLEGSDLLAE